MADRIGPVSRASGGAKPAGTAPDSAGPRERAHARSAAGMTADGSAAARSANGPVAGAAARSANGPVAATAFGVVLAVVYLLVPPMGTDLSAQAAHAAFFTRYGLTPVDFSWYGGVSPYGYSLVTPPLMSWLDRLTGAETPLSSGGADASGGIGSLHGLAGMTAGGPRLLGALALVAAAGAFALLLRRTGARRPLAGGLAGVLCLAGNLVSGRVTYAVGVAFGLLALLALTLPRPWQRHAGALVGAAFAAAASPVAGLFAGLSGAALLLTGVAASTPVGRDASQDHAVSGKLGPQRLRKHLFPRSSVPRRSVPRGSAFRSSAPASLAMSTSAASGVILGVGAAVPMAVMALLFGVDGWMNLSGIDALRAITTSLAVALLVPRRPVRIGALLSAAGVAVAFVVHTPVGLNATRLAVMFTLPVLLAYGTIPEVVARRLDPDRTRARRRSAGWMRRLPAIRPAVPTERLARPALPTERLARPAVRAWQPAAVLAVVAVALAVWQPPVSTVDLRQAGDPATSPAYFQPLLDELARRPVGRVEVVPTANYWESAYVAPAVPMARGWLRQADLARNPLFFDGSLDADSYGRWLRDNAVGYVALADARPSWVGRREAELIRGGLPYLQQVWRGAGWRVYAVADPAPLVGVPGQLVASTGGAVEFKTEVPGDVLIRVRWSRWLSLRGPGGCLRPASDGWTVARVSSPGRYRLSGSLRSASGSCPSSS